MTPTRRASEGVLFLALLTPPLSLAAADQAVLAELDALGARTTRNEAGEVTAVDLTNAWLSDADLA
ncbi:MAG TPA: hypothetical protein VFB80_12675, partial [Pirellulaceae bacterium]|nr:hypothetical protein [Pirellulaceae bacterium]